MYTVHDGPRSCKENIKWKPRCEKKKKKRETPEKTVGRCERSAPPVSGALAQNSAKQR